MGNFSEQNIKKNCPHCNPNSFALKHPLKETGNFWVVCDVYPLIEGHILIIPKQHLSCVGEYPDNLLAEFVKLYHRCSKFLKAEYGSVVTFEHGIIGQTVFHSHVHLFPYQGNELTIIPEGKDKLTRLKDITELKKIFAKYGQYLFFSINSKMWVVDLSLGSPRFFRDRFAKALGRPERGDWKKMHQNKKIMAEVNQEIENLKQRWQKSFPAIRLLFSDTSDIKSV